ncbi:hypothetical protein WN51_12407 [Melipona quadrifasciata]|uniref:Ubiquitin-like domain-containing protein n=1 Tax=Melipona quadrifasciata TaxID=166423 RepID=A0A0M9A2N7_9HYME|nr:hypothetical protein WN51_12407 [Melipona quadrifasciata]
MEVIQLGSSSDDDDDLYLNSVIKLKALKQKRISPQQNELGNEENDKKNEELCTFDRIKKVPNKTVPKQKTRNKRSRRRSVRQRQRRNTSETDSDLEIVSVEEKSKLFENDILIIENNIQEDPYFNEIENYEINIKILWRSKDVHRLNICRNENFQQIFEYFANLEQVSVDEILITKGDKTIKKNDTPASINLSVIDILEGGIVKKNNTTFQKTINNGDTCTIKIQTTSKKSLIVSVKRNEHFKSLLKKCVEEFNVEESKIKLYFDGELIAATNTPDSLEIDDEACFDLQLSS